MAIENKVDISYVVNSRSSSALVRIVLYDPTTGAFEEIEAGGTALRQRPDKHNVEVGTLLSVGRALESLGQKMTKRGEGLVKHADDMREYRKVQAERPRYEPQKEAEASAETS